MLFNLTNSISVKNLKKNGNYLKNKNKSKNNGQRFAKKFFEDNWIADGSLCSVNGFINGQPEEYSIENIKKHVIAKKVSGNLCVQANQISFYFPDQKTYPLNEFIPCTMIEGTPQSPQSAINDDCYVMITSPDAFTISPYNIQFERGELKDLIQ